MKRLRKKTTAGLVLVLAAVISVLGGGGWKLRQERVRAEEVFFNGKAGFSVYHDIMELRETGYNLLRISEEAGGAEAQRRAAASAWARLDEAKTPEDCAAACQELRDAVDALDASQTMESDTLRRSWERQMNDFSEFTSHLRFDSYYDEKAGAYNRLFRDPLTALIGRLTGSGEMPRFTGADAGGER